MSDTSIHEGFKVVHVQREGFFSSHTPGGEVEYKKGEWTEPLEGNGPLLCFGTLEQAKTFVLQHQAKGFRMRIFRCFYRCAETSGRWDPPDNRMAYYGHEPYRCVKRDVCEGTIFASAIQITKAVRVSVA